VAEKFPNPDFLASIFKKFPGGAWPQTPSLSTLCMLGLFHLKRTYLDKSLATALQSHFKNSKDMAAYLANA